VTHHPRIEDLSVDELKAVLVAAVDDLTEEQIQAIENFIDRVGGLDNATLAIEMLSHLEKAA
jgi:hypothetical protein